MQLASQSSCARTLKHAACVLLLALGIGSAPAFSLLGPYDNWQIPEIGYNLPGDVGGPMNITEEFRYNTPNLYYAFNKNFVDYFGTNGIAAVDQAIAMINQATDAGFTDLNINAYPLEGTRINPRAEQLRLLDLKTVTVNLLLEELGLAEPERFVWTLRSRFVQTGRSCPFMIYYVIMRNFDPFTYSPTPYVNNVLFNYEILEICSGPNPLAQTINFPVEFPLDMFAPENTALASVLTVARHGAYVLSLTRDDVGGLRYMYRRDNVNWETIPEGSQQYVTNTLQPQLVFSSNLWVFAQAALTNNAAGLQALYPGLIITDTKLVFTNIYVTNVVAYYTNSGAPWLPVDSIPRLVFVTNRTLTVQTHYVHTFANAFTAGFTDSGLTLLPLSTIPRKSQNVKAYIETIAVTNAPWLPITEPFRTNITFKSTTLRGLYGDFFIMPTNACSLQLLGLQATLVNYVTNSLVSTTNQFGTNVPPVGGGGGGDGGGGGNNNTNNFQLQVPQLTQNLITIESNRVWVAYPVECVSTNVFGLRQGIDRLRFIRTSYDSLVGRYYAPITNHYTLNEITNGRVIPNVIRREITQPDFLFTSQDLVSGQNLNIAGRSTPRWETNASPPGLVGPGTINPGVVITYNRVGPIITHVYNTNAAGGGLNQAAGQTNWIWGSYDGSTNEPVVYPFGTILMDLEPLVLFQIVTVELPGGTVNVPYSAQLQVSGGEPPFYWMPHVDSAPLPPGLSLSSDGVISGTPEWEGEYTFSVTVMDAGERTTTRPLTITINP